MHNILDKSSTCKKVQRRFTYSYLSYLSLWKLWEHNSFSEKAIPLEYNFLVIYLISEIHPGNILASEPKPDLLIQNLQGWSPVLRIFRVSKMTLTTRVSVRLLVAPLRSILSFALIGIESLISGAYMATQNKN